MDGIHIVAFAEEEDPGLLIFIFSFLKLESLNGETATSIWDVTTTKKLLKTTDTSPPTEQKNMYSNFLDTPLLHFVHETKTITKLLGADSGAVSPNADSIFNTVHG